MPSSDLRPNWLCGRCAFVQRAAYEPPASVDARCSCGEVPDAPELLRLELPELRLEIADLKARLAATERRPAIGGPDELLTPEEAAEYLRKPSVRAVYQLVRRGVLTPLRVGRQLRFRRSDLDRVLNGQ